MQEIEFEKKVDELLAKLEHNAQLGISLVARVRELTAELDSFEKDFGATEAELEQSGERMPPELLIATRELETATDAPDASE